MDDRKESWEALARRALQAQIDLGFDEVVLRPPQGHQASTGATDTATAPERETAPAVDLFGEPTEPILASEFASLDDHRGAICECQNCPLGATRNKFVYGVGNPDADLLFIGEAPGADEDRLGEPFVGRAGKLLDKILAAIGFTREQVYIANILKCRPPNNRDPQPDEMEQCFPYLKEQIALLRPKLMCGLGRIAGQALLDTKTPLGKLRGRFHEYQGLPLMVTYHPAALLRNPAFKRGTWEDMQMLRARYDELVGV